MQNPLKNLMLPPEAFHDLKVRLLLLFVFAASVALAWWSINRLPASEKKLAQQNTKITELEKQIDEFGRRWNPQEAEQIAGRFKQSQEQLFAGQDALGGWQADLCPANGSRSCRPRLMCAPSLRASAPIRPICGC